MSWSTRGLCVSNVRQIPHSCSFIIFCVPTAHNTPDTLLPPSIPVLAPHAMISRVYSALHSGTTPSGINKLYRVPETEPRSAMHMTNILPTVLSLCFTLLPSLAPACSYLCFRNSALPVAYLAPRLFPDFCPTGSSLSAFNPLLQCNPTSYLLNFPEESTTELSILITSPRWPSSMHETHSEIFIWLDYVLQRNCS